MTGVTADQHHKRTEAKETPGSAGQESVTWTSAFASTPIVVGSVLLLVAGENRILNVDSRSTTGATVTSREDAGAISSRVKMVMAQEVT